MMVHGGGVQDRIPEALITNPSNGKALIRLKHLSKKYGTMENIVKSLRPIIQKPDQVLKV